MKLKRKEKSGCYRKPGQEDEYPGCRTELPDMQHINFMAADECPKNPEFPDRPKETYPFAVFDVSENQSVTSAYFLCQKGSLLVDEQISKKSKWCDDLKAGHKRQFCEGI